jgi:hypothetical protein
MEKLLKQYLTTGDFPLAFRFNIENENQNIIDLCTEKLNSEGILNSYDADFFIKKILA